MKVFFFGGGGSLVPFLTRLLFLVYIRSVFDVTHNMAALIWFLFNFLFSAIFTDGFPVDMVVEYTTTGDVKLNILNITFHTIQLQVELLGCDYGYYDDKRILAHLHCVPCECSNFEFERSENFIAV